MKLDDVTEADIANSLYAFAQSEKRSTFTPGLVDLKPCFALT